jgi:hypothetical protein
VRGTITLGIALAAAAVAPAAASATTTTTYRVTKATGSEVVAFSADPGTCARFVTCGYHGTVTYRFGGTPSGRLVLNRGARGHVTGAADFSARGTTVADVTAGDACTDTVRHRREHFSMRSPSRLGKLIFGLHGAKTDYLATDCAGPTEADLKRDGALPTGKFRRKDFAAQATTFTLKGSASFREKGYRGGVAWKLKYRVARSG